MCIGLDPARPLFEVPKMPPDFSLDAGDADFVDILHTCGGVYGYRESHGDADFYPNNGRPMQPGCDGARQVAGKCRNPINLLPIGRKNYKNYRTRYRYTIGIFFTKHKN